MYNIFTEEFYPSRIFLKKIKEKFLKCDNKESNKKKNPCR